ncbi:MAG: histidine phosphotransferase family protein [Hyphomicrobiaceae bacterium]
MSGKDDEAEALELAALVSSKICHDLIGPVGAIFNGVEMLDSEADEDARADALDLIRTYTEVAKAKLQFMRFAFGAAGSAGAVLDLREAEQIARGYFGRGKHTLTWKVPPGQMAKNRAKLLLNLVAIAQTALVKGGDIEVGLTGRPEDPGIEIRCRGQGARPPQTLTELVNGSGPVAARDALTVQAYYARDLAEASGVRLSVATEGGDIVIRAAR